MSETVLWIETSLTNARAALAKCETVIDNQIKGANSWRSKIQQWERDLALLKQEEPADDQTSTDD